jgi:hypothetical protein
MKEYMVLAIEEKDLEDFRKILDLLKIDIEINQNSFIVRDNE